MLPSNLDKCKKIHNVAKKNIEGKKQDQEDKRKLNGGLELSHSGHQGNIGVGNRIASMGGGSMGGGDSIGACRSKRET